MEGLEVQVWPTHRGVPLAVSVVTALGSYHHVGERKGGKVVTRWSIDVVHTSPSLAPWHCSSTQPPMIHALMSRDRAYRDENA